jgi:hypothetical protein
MKPCNNNIIEALNLSHQLLLLADKGDIEREDDGCGVLFGIIRDSAYRIQSEAKKEVAMHKKNGKWDTDTDNV